MPQLKQGFCIRVNKRDSSARIELLNAGPCCSATTTEGVTLVQYGEVFGEEGLLETDRLLNEFRLKGGKCASSYDGAFVLVFFAVPRGNVTVITDRVNAMKCFFEETEDSIFLASSICFLREANREVDPIGLTSFLANGAIYHNRTIYKNVRSLQRASVHLFSGSKAASCQPYWEYKFDDQYRGRKSSDLKQELAEALFKAVKKRVTSGTTIYLSLSGGYDSTCILGLLASIPIHSARVLSHYTDCLDLAALGGGYDEEVSCMVKECCVGGLHDAKDFLYLDQRLGNVIAPWRELFCGRSHVLRNPFLDSAVLNFVAHLPGELRRGKRLYKETVRLMFPELFTVERAHKRPEEGWRMALDRQRTTIEDRLRSAGDGGPECVRWNQCVSLLPRGQRTVSLKERLLRSGKEMLKATRLARKYVALFPPRALPCVDPQLLLLRVLMLGKRFF